MKTISLIINKIMMKLSKRWRCKLCIIFGGHVLNDVNGGYVHMLYFFNRTRVPGPQKIV